jgi:uncharacterized membrane protein YeaQ/YmgE (transglycosylase-associated protein family)
MVLEEAGIVAWLMVALPVGLFATTFAGGRGYGKAADVLVGLAGAVLGVLAAGLIGIQGQGGWLAGILATVAGALLLTMAARLAPRRLSA